MKEKQPIESSSPNSFLIIPTLIVFNEAFKGLESADHMLPKLALGLGAIGVVLMSIGILSWIRGRNRK